MTALNLRLQIGPLRIGPGKVALLEAIARTGSISGAGRAMRMSYRRAWELVEDLNRGLGQPVAETAAGGTGGGGARLTPAGEAVIRHYRTAEALSRTATASELSALAALLRNPEAAPGVPSGQPRTVPMTDDKKPAPPADDETAKPAVQPVDEGAQEDAAEERKETGGYQ